MALATVQLINTKNGKVLDTEHFHRQWIVSQEIQVAFHYQHWVDDTGLWYKTDPALNLAYRLTIH